MHRTRLLLPLLACAVSACATARPAAEPATTAGGELPRTHAPRPTTGAIAAADLTTRLFILADDSMLGREAGTLGNVKATAYVEAEMRRIGLVPAGENGGYFQTVPVVRSRLDSTRTLAVNGAPLVPGVDVFPIENASSTRLLPQGAATRSLDGATVVYGGELGGPAPLLDPAQAAGRVVLFTVRPDTAGVRDWRFYRVAPVAQYGAAAGIAAVVLDAMPPAVRARLAGEQVRVQATGLTGQAPLTMLVTPAAAVRMMGVGSLAGVAVGAAGRTLAGTLAFVATPTAHPARNVVGVLPGADPARRGQYVAVGAHNDHVGVEDRPLDHDSVLAFNQVLRRQGVQDAVRTPTAAQRARIAALRDSLTAAHGGARADSVNNGADDDGSGTVALLEIAERFATAKERPARSILFVSHTGEEKGLWGSEWYTDHPTVPRDSIVAQLNMDMVGRGKPTDIMGRGPNNVQLIGPRRLSTQLGDLIDSVNAGRTPRMAIDASFDANGHPLNRYCRSDHYMYARYGIPITYFSLGYHTDYHQVTDEPQYIDYGHAERIAGFVHDVARAVADRPARLVVDKPVPDLAAGCRQ